MREERTILDAFRRAAHLAPDEPAVSDGERTLTWREHAARVRALAVGLSRLGVSPGEVLAVDPDDRAGAVTAGTAVLAVGGAVWCGGAGRAAASGGGSGAADPPELAGRIDRGVVVVRGRSAARGALEAGGSREDGIHPERFDGMVDDRAASEVALVGPGGSSREPVVRVDHAGLLAAARSVDAAVGAVGAARLWHVPTGEPVDAVSAWMTGPALHAWTGGHLDLLESLPAPARPPGARRIPAPGLAVVPPDAGRRAIAALDGVRDVGAPPGLLSVWRRASRRAADRGAPGGARLARRWLDASVGSRARRAAGLAPLRTVLLAGGDPELVARSEASGLPAMVLLGSAASGPALLVRRSEDGSLETRPLPGVAARRDPAGGIDARSPVTGGAWVSAVDPERAEDLPPLRGRPTVP